MTTDSIKRYTVSGDIAYPINEDPEGDYVTYEDHVAAIEADRQRRGEPVAWRWKWKDLPNAGWQLSSVGECQETDAIKAEPLYLAPIAPQPALDAADLAFIADELQQAGKNRAADLVLTAMAYPTQPAEPVKVPSDTEIDELSREWGLQSAAYPSKSMVRDFARALLARYGKGTP